MSLTQKEIQELGLGNTGLPAGFQGDRLDAFRHGLNTAIEVMKDKVSMDKVDKVKEDKK
jgi:hypothetical protein